MPGVHTFYDGSTALQPVADMVGVEVDKINLVLCQFLSIPLALVQYKLITTNGVSRTVRLAFPPFIGLMYCYFCYGNAIKHLLSNVGISFLLMHYAPPQYVHKLVFVFSLGYLVFIHWYRWYILSTYSIDVTGPMMVLVQKVTVLAFSLYDGRVKRPEELNAIQRREAIATPPAILEYMSYLFQFQTVQTGPLCFYTDYIKWIDGTNAIGKDGKLEKPWKVTIIKLVQACFFLFVIVKFGDYYPEMIAEEEYMKWHWVPWCMLFFFVIFLQRVLYYFAWTIADAVSNASGFGFNGYDENGDPKWDLVSNVNFWKVELASSFKVTLDSWNICTMYWLRRVAYDRAPKRYRTVATYLVSAIWHGFFFGYYITFLTGALMTVAGRTVRKCLRYRFQGSRNMRILYWFITFTSTKIILAYTTYPFVTMHLIPGLFIYRYLYFFAHILALGAIFILPIILPPERTEKPKSASAGGASPEEKKTE